MHNPFLVRPLYFLYSLIFPSKAYNKENFPKGRALIVANHYSALDACYMYKFVKKDIFFLAKKEALKKKFASWFLKEVGAIPIDRENNDVRAMMNAMKVLKEDKKLVVFPEGTRNKVDMELKDIKGGAGVFAVKTKTPVVPIIFYNRAKAFRRRIMIVGKPFELTEFYDKKLQKEDIDKIDEIIREKMLEAQKEIREIKSKKKKCK